MKWIEYLVGKLVDGLVYVIQLLVDELRAFGDALIGGLVDLLASVVPAVDAPTINGWLNAGNYFLPISEGAAILVGLFGLWVAVWVYRLVKSWIPTVSGT